MFSKRFTFVVILFSAVTVNCYSWGFSDKETPDGSDESTTAFPEGGLDSFDMPNYVQKAANWVLSQREENGWGEESLRAIVALTSTSRRLLGKNVFLQMRQQLTADVALDLIKNVSRSELPLYQLAQYVRALIATCQDPSKFYSRDLVQELRSKTSKILFRNGRSEVTVAPSLLLTLCLSNKSRDEDVNSLIQTAISHVHDGTNKKRYDLEAYTQIALACLNKRYDRYHNTYNRSFHHLNETIREYVRKVQKGDVYTLGLLLQALNAWSDHPEIHLLSDQKEFIRQSLLDLQKDDGSFGDMLATYYALPALANHSIIDLDSCAARIQPYAGAFGKNVSVSIHLWVIRNGKLESNSMDFRVRETSTLFDAMLSASKKNPLYRFKYDETVLGKVIYELSGIANDGEKAQLWCFYDNPKFTISEQYAHTIGGQECRTHPGMDFIRVEDRSRYLFFYKSFCSKNC